MPVVYMGNAAPKGTDGAVIPGAPRVTRVWIPEHYTFDPNVDVEALRGHLYDSLIGRGGITSRPDDEAMLVVTHASGMWPVHSACPPTWVECDNVALAAAIARFYGCPVGAPADVEQTHHTFNGPPGVTYGGNVTALVVNSGLDIASRALGGQTVGGSGTSTATTATTLTDSTQAWTVNAYAGMRVVSGAAWGLILSNTATALTIDRWYVPATPGGAAAAIPATGTYVILAGSPPAWFVGLANNSTAPVASDTTMGGEIVNGTPTGENNVIGTLPTGLLRQIAPFAHTAGSTTFTLTPVFTTNSNESGILPVTVGRISVSTSLIPGNGITMFAETLLNATATFAAVADQLTVTYTLTL